MTIFGILTALTLGHSLPAFAEEAALDPSAREALKKTQQMLRDAKERAKEISQDEGAQQVDNQVQKLGGNDTNAQAIYGLAADVFDNIAKESQGDPVKMQELLELAKKDPKAFAAKFSPEQRAKLKEISNRVPAQPAKPAQH